MDACGVVLVHPGLPGPVDVYLDYRTYSQSKTKDAVLQGMEPACKKYQENFIRDRGECTLWTWSPVLDSLKFSLNL